MTTDRVSGAVKTASSALKELPSYKGTVGRGTDLTEAQLAKYVVGEIVAEKAFLSTSPVSSMTFGGNTRFVIDARQGGKSVKLVSAVRWETEVLFAPGTAFKVLDKWVGDGVNVISLR